LDVGNPAEIEQVKTWVIQEFGRLDGLINNAAVYPDAGQGLVDLPMEVFLHTFEINTFGPLILCQAFIPLMKKQNYGRIVNISSGMGAISTMGGYTGAYRASKAALNAITRILASEVHRYNIKVNAMCPGWVRSDMGGRGAPRSLEQGADTAVWLATLPDDGPTNGFFRDRYPIAW
jgi:NAD(P)-dependent dehydrogenase (short-subunit alcohol dehydrogenase family)